MGAMLGLTCRVYINSASGSSAHATPTWVNSPCVRDTTVDLSFDEVDATCRGSGGFRQSAVTLTSLEVSGDVIKDWDDPAFVALELAARTKSIVDVMVLDGPRDVDGSSGWRFDAQIMSWSEEQPLEDIIKVSFKLKPARSEHVPQFVEIIVTP